MAFSRKPVSMEKAKLRLAGLCSRSEQSQFDISRKLRNMFGLTEAQRREILDFLVEEKYIDDARYAKSLANDKAHFSYWGPRKIRAFLSLKKIPSPLISEALGRVEQEDWEKALRHCAEAKSKTLELTGEDGYEERKKLFVYLIGRGFDSKDANRMVRIMRERQEEEKNHDTD